MEAEVANPNHQPSFLHRLLPAVIPVLLIAIGYVDPGKWAATIEGGAHFGFDLLTIMLVFNFAAILCQYLSARIGVITGRDLAQICSDEYDKFTCIFLGIQTELSVIALDLTMILGVAHGLNLLFAVDLATCVFLAAVDAILFPLFATLVENHMAKFLFIWATGLLLLSYVLGVLVSQQEIPFSMSGMLIKLNGDSAFALISLLGASIMPHNFYLHSSIVQLHKGSKSVSKSALCHDHFFAILCVFSGIYLVNYVLMSSAATVFYSTDSTGVALLTFQDAMSLIEQVFRSPVAPLAFLVVLFFSNQITALTWNLGGQVVIHDFLRLEIPGWLHRLTIRIIAVVPILYCVWTSGAEGIYQLLVFTQVMVALLLPSSVIPLFRVASSRPIMGVYKISQCLEFLALITFMGMLGVKIIFVTEMIFGHSDWVGNLRWNTGSSTSVPYVVLLMTACGSFCLTLWLAATPLKSASSRLDNHVWSLEVQKAVPEPSIQREENVFSGTGYFGEESVQEPEPLPALVKSVESHSDITPANFDLSLPETLEESNKDIPLTTVQESHSNITFPTLPVCLEDDSASTGEALSFSTAANEVADAKFVDTKTVKIESMDPVEKMLVVEADLQAEKDDDEGDTWEPEESSKGVHGSTSSLTSDGPGSLKSLIGKSDDGGNGAGSLSRIAGLGRAARRQLAAVLDEFWGQLYDFHGQVTTEGKAMRLDVVLGVESKSVSSSFKVDTTGKEFSGYFQSVRGRESDSQISSSLHDFPQQPRMPTSVDSSYGVQRGSSSLLANHMQLLNAYVHNSGRNVHDSGERRYSSLRNPPSSEGWDYQPATVHGYQIASYVSRIAKDRNSVYLDGQMESPPPKSPSLVPTDYKDTFALALGKKLQHEMNPAQASGFPNLAVSRNSSLQSEISYYDVPSSRPADSAVKKYHSLPDISGLSVPQRDPYLSDKNSRWDSSVGYGSSVNRAIYESPLYSNTGARAGPPLAFDEVSPSKVFTKAFPVQYPASSDTGSLWSRQPFEQFGVADKSRVFGSVGIGSSLNSLTQEATSIGDSEAKLLQSFRHCIVKLLKLEGSEWLFRQNDGVDEDLIERVAAREKFLYEAENVEMKYGSALKDDDSGSTSFCGFSVPHCGDGCIWKADLIISFGIWCIHRVLDLSLMESRPELWGKYTYVLNRLQGVIDLAFSKPRSPMAPCFCLQIPVAYQQRSNAPVSNGMLPPAAKPGRGKCTTTTTLFDIVKDVEIAISCRKGRTGTAAGDVAFPKGKENLASVLKRYKRRLSHKLVGNNEGSGSRKFQTSAPYGS
ncbi:Nramp domain-containing protein [Cephalotus follicularis]|uniref:Nramp domain-containing protein n=1 Tax=Cephalotus follicularis TaxID=3775 RepID=A0A1Q3D7V4_CEPFO|nr:Nramp domain-containing protein [Cephalotus follicularis]